ncbi:KH domain-containing protein [Thermodesulfobacteriota bacterium]
MAKAIVDNPEEVVVTEINGARSSVIELKVAKEDIVRIIGRHGHTIEAIRPILSAASMKLNTRSVLDLL